MMTITQMVEDLKNRGFEVERHWIPNTKDCQFIIRKNGVGAIGMYTWKPDCTYEQISAYQRDFLRRLVSLWQEQYKLCCRKRVKDFEKQVFESIYGKDSFGQFGRICLSSARPGVGSTQFDQKIREFITYSEADANITKEPWPKMNPYVIKLEHDKPTIKDVIFNNPATIVFWSDDTKTVVKCQDGDVYDPEKGLAMAISKKFFGNKGNYCNEINKWVEKHQSDSVNIAIDAVKAAMSRIKITVPKIHLNINTTTTSTEEKNK